MLVTSGQNTTTWTVSRGVGDRGEPDAGGGDAPSGRVRHASGYGGGARDGDGDRDRYRHRRARPHAGPSSGPITAPSLRTFVTVMDAPWSATGNGVTDDTTAVQDAVNAVSTAGGGIVQFPEGYSFYVKTIPPQANVTIWAWGATFTINPLSSFGIFDTGQFHRRPTGQLPFTRRHLRWHRLRNRAAGLFRVGAGNVPSSAQDWYCCDIRVTGWGTGVIYFANCIRGERTSTRYLTCCVYTGSTQSTSPSARPPAQAACPITNARRSATSSTAAPPKKASPSERRAATMPAPSMRSLPATWSSATAPMARAAPPTRSTSNGPRPRPGSDRGSSSPTTTAPTAAPTRPRVASASTCHRPATMIR